DKKSRVLAHIEQIGRPTRPPTSGAHDAPPTSSQRPGGDAGGGGRPATAPPPAQDVNAAIAERVDKLAAPQKVAYRRACQANGIEAFLNPPEELLDRALVLLGKIEKGEAPT